MSAAGCGPELASVVPSSSTGGPSRMGSMPRLVLPDLSARR